MILPASATNATGRFRSSSRHARRLILSDVTYRHVAIGRCLQGAHSTWAPGAGSLSFSADSLGGQYHLIFRGHMIDEKPERPLLWLYDAAGRLVAGSDAAPAHSSTLHDIARRSRSAEIRINATLRHDFTVGATVAHADEHARPLPVTRRGHAQARFIRRARSALRADC